MSVTIKAKIGNGTTIAKSAVIADSVEIGDNCVIAEGVIIRGGVKIGNNNHIYPYAGIGEDPQDLSYKNEVSYVEIGDNNRIREFVTVHRGTGEGSKTIIGSDCLIMAYAHVGHNCIVGNHVILTNSCQLAGYVVLGDYVVIGGDASVHQHCRIGDCTMLGGKSATNQDIPPYVVATGIPARGITVNRHGLRRAKVPSESIRRIREAFNVLYREGNTLKTTVAKMEAELSDDPYIVVLLKFLQSSKRGVKLNGPTWGGNEGDDIDFDE